MTEEQIFNDMIRVALKSQSFKPKFRVTARLSPESQPNRPEKGTPHEAYVLLQRTSLKAFLNTSKE